MNSNTLRLKAKPVYCRGAIVTPPEFWFVWAPTEYAPKRRHDTLASAQAEAKRLNTLYPEKAFHVFRAEQVQP
jgi:hypothetical protein